MLLPLKVFDLVHIVVAEKIEGEPLNVNTAVRESTDGELVPEARGVVEANVAEPDIDCTEVGVSTEPVEVGDEVETREA